VHHTAIVVEGVVIGIAEVRIEPGFEDTAIVVEGVVQIGEVDEAEHRAGVQDLGRGALRVDGEQ